MSFLHLHISNKVESGGVSRQANRGELEHVVDERCSGFRRECLVIRLESFRQEPPIFLVIMHAIITLKAINNNETEWALPWARFAISRDLAISKEIQIGRPRESYFPREQKRESENRVATAPRESQPVLFTFNTIQESSAPMLLSTFSVSGCNHVFVGDDQSSLLLPLI